MAQVEGQVKAIPPATCEMGTKAVMIEGAGEVTFVTCFLRNLYNIDEGDTMTTTRIIILFLILSFLAVGPLQSTTPTVKELSRLRNQCDFLTLTKHLEAKHAEEPDNLAITDMLVANLLKMGETDKARDLLKAVSLRGAGEKETGDFMDDLGMLFSFYEKRDFTAVSNIEREQGFSPSGLEAVILASILSGNSKRFEACSRFQMEPYHCLLARVSAGTYAPINVPYRATLPARILKYCNGEMTFDELKEALATCFSDLPIYSELLMEVLTLVEEKRQSGKEGGTTKP